ncbi:hypothetical protein Tco_1200193 [Tanacetum coccineum]
MVVQNQSKLGEVSANPTDPRHTPTITQSSTQPQKTQILRKPKRKDTQVPQPSVPSKNVADRAVHKELGNSLVRATTIASSLEAEQDSVGLTARVESSGDEEDLGEDASKQGRRINVIDADEDWQNENIVEEVVDATQVSTAATTVIITTKEITLAQALEALKNKGKGIMIEEPVKPMKKKVQIMLDEEAALKLQAEFDEEERLAREKAKKEKRSILLLD